MLGAIPRSYLLTALSVSPELLSMVVRPLDQGDPRWDARPDPDRFTLREALAHVADWDRVFLRRLRATLEHESPILQDFDAAASVAEQDYSHRIPASSLEDYRSRRADLLALLHSLKGDAWSRPAIHRKFGAMTMEDQAVLALAHDGYHLQQAMEWMKR